MKTEDRKQKTEESGIERLQSQRAQIKKQMTQMGNTDSVERRADRKTIH